MVVGIAVAIAAVHLFRLGTILRGAWRQGYYAYASDVLLAVVADRIVLARWLPGWSAPGMGGT